MRRSSLNSKTPVKADGLFANINLTGEAYDTMHEKYHQLLDPAYLQYALEVESAPPVEGENIALMRERYNENHHRHSSPAYTDVLMQDRKFTGRDGHSIPTRSYTPQNAATTQLTLYLHGGGWVLGNLDTHDDICMDIALATGRPVLAVDYRLAPEHPFPAALHDVCDVIAGLQADDFPGIDTSNGLLLSGDSAGANLCVAACLSGDIKTLSIAGLMLIYPGLGADDSLPSFTAHEFAPILPRAVLETFFSAYLGGDLSRANPLSSPLLADDLSALPPCFISAAEHDPLRDDAIAFRQKLTASGVYCTFRLEERLGHGYLRVRHESRDAGSAFDAACRWIGDMHESHAASD